MLTLKQLILQFFFGSEHFLDSLYLGSARNTRAERCHGTASKKQVFKEIVYLLIIISVLVFES